MITVTGTFTVKKDKIQEVLDGARKVQNASTANDEGCIEYKFHQLSEDPASFFVYEIWDTAQSLDKHAASQHFKDFASLLEGSLEKELDIRIYTAI